jgi:hypothetical protein
MKDYGTHKTGDESQTGPLCDVVVVCKPITYSSPHDEKQNPPTYVYVFFGSLCFSYPQIQPPLPPPLKGDGKAAWETQRLPNSVCAGN